MAAARTSASAVVLANGSVLVTGGSDADGNALASAEMLGGGAAAPMSAPRSGHVSVALNDGTVLIAGGAAAHSAEIYTPAGGGVTIASAPLADGGFTATLLDDGRVLFAGGTSGGATTAVMQIFDPATGQFTNAAPMSTPRANHAAALLADGRVVLAGGSNGGTALASVEIYDPAANAVASAPSMAAARSGLSATVLLDQRVLLAGGGSASTEILNVAAGTISAGPSMSVARSGHLALRLPLNNTVLMAGGTQASAAAEIFVPWTNQFQAFGSLSSARTGVAGGASRQIRTARVAGGTDAGGVSAAVDAVGYPTVVSDKDDYSPGTPAVITGAGFEPGETVTLTLQEEPYLDTHGPFTAVADGNGNFTNSDFVPDSNDVGIRFYLAATGESSGLTGGTTFTDSVQLNSVSVGAQSPASVAPGSSATYSVTIGFSGNNSTCDATLSVTTSLPTGATVVGFSPNPASSSNGDDVISTLTISTTAATPAGSYPFTVTAIPGSGCGGNSSTKTGSGTLVVAAAANTAPAVNSNNASVTVDEGDTAMNTGTWSDANAGDTVTLSASIGTVIKSGTNAGGTWSWSFGTTDGPGQSQTVTITADDGTTMSSTSFALTVNNVVPTVTPNALSAINEGDSATASATFSDPGGTNDAPYTCTVDYGDGSGTQAGTVSGNMCTGPSHTYVDNVGSPFTVTIKVKDKDGGEGTGTTSQVVNNVVPTVTPDALSAIDEGGSATASATFSDPGGASDAPYTCTVNYGDGSGAQAGTVVGNTCTGPSHTYVDNVGSPFTVTIKVTDKDGGEGTGTGMQTVNNVVPTVVPGALSAINEGDSVMATAMFSDPGGSYDAPYTCAVNYGDGSGDLAGVVSNAGAGPTCTGPSHTYPDDNPTGTASDMYTVTIMVTDKDGGTGGNSTSLTVNNVNPTVDSIVLPQDPMAVMTSVPVSGNFSDVGVQDTHTCTIDFGDGSTPVAGSISETNGSGTCSSAHVYSSAGLYNVTVSVTDDDTGMGSLMAGWVVIYDPNGGFVTGGGWIMSPEGAYVADPSLTGKATFGFVSKYKKGATVPDGDTEFQFKAGNLNFKSTAYEWLVIAGARAQYKGSGTINGAGNYGFMLTAIDGEVNGGGDTDKFRIKIWDKNNGDMVVYDNQLGADDGADPTTMLGGGSIVIHTAGGNGKNK